MRNVIDQQNAEQKAVLTIYSYLLRHFPCIHASVFILFIFHNGLTQM